MDGILNVNKPPGWTSFDVVAFIRGRSHQRRTGHAGTLDPFATGVLPIALGQATRVIEYLMDARKTYQGTVRLGLETDTYDRTGQVTSESDAADITPEEVEAALRGFEGAIEQRAPAYSALKQDGVPLYRLARSGQKVEAPVRTVHVYRIRLVSFEAPLAEIEVDCGRGTYIRSLAHDLGQALGVGASLEGLTRTAVGPFTLERAVDIETLRAQFESGRWRDRLLALDEVLLEMPAAILAQENTLRLRQGRTVEAEGALAAATDAARAYSTQGDFLAVVRPEGTGLLRPIKVFAAK